MNSTPPIRLLRKFASTLFLLPVLGVPSVSVLAQEPDLVAKTEAKTPAEEVKAFRLPKGLKAQLVAAEPDIHKPMNLAFDDQGRLWVTATLEYPYPAKDPAKARDKVFILSDFGADGKAGKVTTFATGLNIPIGLLPVPGKSPQRALVFQINQILLLEDTDGDGKADKKEAILTGYGFRDTHGMTNAFNLAPDGWIYATHGFSNQSEIRGKDGRSLKLQSGNTYRFRPDGTGLEQYTFGQVNPFGLAMDRYGNFYTADCHTRPVYALLQGAYYPSFGKPHDGLGYGPEMCRHDHGSTGIAGCLIYSGDLLAKECDGQVFLGNVVTSRLNRDRIDWKGASPVAVELPDLIASSDPWFRPVDMKTGPDGAIYIADFYNRIIGHYEVPLTHPGRDRHRGRIWRIVPEDYNVADSTAVGNLPAKSTEELLSLLDGAQWELAIRASYELEGRARASEGAEPNKKGVVQLATSGKSAQARALALWTLLRAAPDKAKVAEAVLDALKSAEPLVRVHAVRMVASLGAENPALVGFLREQALKDAFPLARRAAAESLARLKSPDNVDPLLAAMAVTPGQDDHLGHALKISLRDQFLPGEEAVKQAWEKANREGRSVAETAFLAAASLGVPSGQAAAYLSRHLMALAGDQEKLLGAFRHIGRHGDDAALQLAFAYLDGPKGKNGTLSLVREAILGTRESGRPINPELMKRANAVALADLASPNGAQIDQAVSLVGELRLEGLASALVEILKGAKKPDGQRIAAAQALVNLSAGQYHPVVLDMLKDPTHSAGLREQWAIMLGRVHQPGLMKALAEVINVLPYRMQLAAARELASNQGGAGMALELMASGKWPPRLIRDRVIVTKLEGAGVKDVKEKIAALEKTVPPGDNRVDDLIKARVGAISKSSGFNAAAGKELYTKHCAACHQLAGAGAKVGPQLDGIGARGLERMCEDILDPSRNVDQAFRQSIVALKSGQVHTGLVTRDEGNLVVLVDQLGKEIPIEKSNIEERKVTNLSPMPANFAESIPEKDFLELLGFLLSQKVPAPTAPPKPK